MENDLPSFWPRSLSKTSARVSANSRFTRWDPHNSCSGVAPSIFDDPEWLTIERKTPCSTRNFQGETEKPFLMRGLAAKPATLSAMHSVAESRSPGARPETWRITRQERRINVEKQCVRNNTNCSCRYGVRFRIKEYHGKANGGLINVPLYCQFLSQLLLYNECGNRRDCGVPVAQEVYASAIQPYVVRSVVL